MHCSGNSLAKFAFTVKLLNESTLCVHWRCRHSKAGIFWLFNIVCRYRRKNIFLWNRFSSVKPEMPKNLPFRWKVLVSPIWWAVLCRFWNRALSLFSDRMTLKCKNWLSMANFRTNKYILWTSQLVFKNWNLRKTKNQNVATNWWANTVSLKGQT